MQRDRTLWYANLNSFNSSAGITDEQMCAFFESMFGDNSCNTVGVVIDRVDDEIPLSKREGWSRVRSACQEGTVDLIFVPSISMMTVSPGDVSYIIESMKREFGVNFYFIHDSISTVKEGTDIGLQLHLMTLQSRMEMKKKEDAMRDLFRKVTSLPDTPSAVPVYVDDVQYKKAEKLAHAYGMSVRELMSALISFSTIPQNKVAFEEHILGIEPQKQHRGRPSKQSKE